MINDRQFYINKEEKSFFENWKRITLNNGYTLHYQPNLNISFNDGHVVLIGYAWQVDPNRKTPQEELQQISNLDKIPHSIIYDIEKTWCGRYILIVDNWVYLDATGKLGLFYSHQTITSSLHVLCQVEGRDLIYPDMKKGESPDFFPGVGTPYKDIARLVPSQILSISEKECKLRPLFVDELPSYETEEQRIADLTKYFVCATNNMAKLFEGYEIWLALTAGRDSRAVISMFEKSNLKYSTFTLWHNHIADADWKLPAKIARAVKRPYRKIARLPQNYSQERYDNFRIHTAGMSIEEDWNFYTYNQYQQLRSDEKPIVILRSGVWGTVAKQEDPMYIEHTYPYVFKKEDFKQSVSDWLKILKEDTINTNISFTTRTFWELREGCWLSSVEQSFDMMDGVISIQPLNCRLFLSILVGFKAEERFQKIHEEKIAAYNYPTLLKVPYDYQYNAKRQKRKRLANKIKQFVKRTISKLFRR